MNDYALGLPNANVFLVNYGVVSNNISLAIPHRSFLFGEIRPLSKGTTDFITSMRSFVPVPVIKSVETIEGFSSITIECLAIDVSGSLNKNDYREFVKKFILFILKHGKLNYMIAVDTAKRKMWLNPTSSDVQELLALSFNNATDFTEILPDLKNLLVITDKDGLKAIESAGKAAYVINYINSKEHEIHLFPR